MSKCNFTMLVHGRLNLTKQALMSLKRSGCMRDLSITIFQDGEDEPMADFLSDWCDDNNAEYMTLGGESIGTGLARNCVIRASEEENGRSEFLYLSDNDVFFFPGWLEILIKAYRAAWMKDFKVVGGYNHPFHQPVASLPVDGCCEVRQIEALALQSMLMTWYCWDKYGPFCTTPVGRVCMGEDVEFAWRIGADKGKLGVVHPAVIVNTGITNSFGDKIPGWEMVKAQCPSGVLCE
jgi:hypothetical protein